jgi:hypothetical protein
VLAEVTELQLELPYAFAHEEYEQILIGAATSAAPQLGWSDKPFAASQLIGAVPPSPWRRTARRIAVMNQIC